MKYTVGIVSLGCAKNLVDTETMLGILSEKGYQIVIQEEAADILIVNTCGFIESAKQESINIILKLAQYKKNGRCKALIVAGCLAERYREELQNEIPEIDGIIGTGNFYEITKVIQKTLRGEKYLNYGNQDYLFKENLSRLLATPSHTAYIKIADGCDHFCTYCIIPYLRGRYRSRKIEDIINEAENLSRKGVKEIIIIAQDIGEYGKDIYGEYKLAHLLKELVKIKKIQWIRLLYVYPENITDELIQVIKNNDKICNYIDIPLQHSHNEILKKMGRRITKEEILSLIKNLRNRIPDIVIRTSLIVGFPGEEKYHFQDLLNFVKKIQLDHIGVFPYSMEENTPAAQFPNQIDEQVKKLRQDRVMEIQQSISLKKNEKKIGKIYKILVEGKENQNNIYYGRSYEFAPDIDGLVYFKSDIPITIGEFYRVRINKAFEYDLLGDVINENESCK
ncbi:30S ribosomal protein S12 methylthiotransferase RimO [Garciella nitratireducens]|uniref:30S ribosomal protein S12 methylthiotransferase RimO n=1 Tax=Garciella nitratireducens TaxID=218205 RepID=UPI001BD3731F|nr:30S ribosomal protein S12 methylthiotransferase RimO [Garciella nitratireducens]